jgi:large subunit ribosomal protein L25
MAQKLAGEAIMEKRLLLEAEVREKVGTKEAARLRQEARLPGTVYGHKQDPVSISLNAHEIERAVHHGHRVMDVKIAGTVETLMIKDLQYDYLGRDVIHMDLMRVDSSETVKVTVGIELKGIAKGLSEGGMLEEHADALEIECVVTNIPESLAVSVKTLTVGESLHASDIVLPEGITLISPADTLLVACTQKPAAASEEDAEEGEGEDGPVTPEVITERKPEDD